MPENQPCSRCGELTTNAQLHLLGFFPVVLCSKCRQEIEQYLRTIPKYKEWYYYTYTLVRINPDNKDWNKYLGDYYTLQTELLPIIIKWLNGKEHKKGNLVSIKKGETDGHST